MSAEAILEKMKKAIDKLSINSAIEVYFELGKYLHEKVEKAEKEVRELADKLKGTQ